MTSNEPSPPTPSTGVSVHFLSGTDVTFSYQPQTGLSVSNVRHYPTSLVASKMDAFTIPSVSFHPPPPYGTLSYLLNPVLIEQQTGSPTLRPIYRLQLSVPLSPSSPTTEPGFSQPPDSMIPFTECFQFLAIYRQAKRIQYTVRNRSLTSGGGSLPNLMECSYSNPSLE